MKCRKILGLVCGIFISSMLFVSASSIQATDAIPSTNAAQNFIDRSELEELLAQISHRVDIFQTIWSKDPEALIYGGAVRDLAYWILSRMKHDRSRAQIMSIIDPSRDLALRIQDIINEASDIDVMTDKSEQLKRIDAKDFGIRRVDIHNKNILDPSTDEFKNDWHQGFIPAEKLILSKEGLIQWNGVDGLQDIASGPLRIHLPTTEEFRSTSFAKRNENHLILLVLRYIRLLIIDSHTRHSGNHFDLEKVLARIDPAKKVEILRIVTDSFSDDQFYKFIENEKGKYFLISLLEKILRQNHFEGEAIQIMHHFGFQNILSIFSDYLPSFRDHLAHQNRDPELLESVLKSYGTRAEEIFRPIKEYLPNRVLLHGTRTEEAFRSIIQYGAIPSTDGSAGSGIYGVSQNELRLARYWAKQSDRVIRLTLSENTRLIDITDGIGKALYERWKTRKSGTWSLSSFAAEFQADLIAYPWEVPAYSYSGLAFVLKNPQKIEERGGYFRNPRTLLDLVQRIQNISAANYKEIIMDIESSSLKAAEFKLLSARIPQSFREKMVRPQYWRKAEVELGDSIVPLLVLLWHEPFDQRLIHRLIDLLNSSSEKIAKHTFDFVRYLLLENQWPSEYLKPLRKILRTKVVGRIEKDSFMTFLRYSDEWNQDHWKLALDLFSDDDENIRLGMVHMLDRWRKHWPDAFWNLIPKLRRDSYWRVSHAITDALTSREEWPIFFLKRLWRIKNTHTNNSYYWIKLIAEKQKLFTPELIQSFSKSPRQSVHLLKKGHCSNHLAEITEKKS